ncbi:unnamed protein product [Paramecium primaurelia]|uniref:H-type lectin domain-containing protein n=1 Tax=Paramecium primaurelia TaxID=5886 RepID=A0A8S1N8J8_PARPR|nr:unnamed protein product [Paramecium primaurelia]
MFQSILFLMFFHFSYEYIKYDTGLFLGFDYESASFNCQNGFSKTSVIQFSGTFENIPQVFIYIEKIDWSQAQLEFSLSITTITTISFTITTSCANNRIYRNQIRWFALDDRRIEVLNNFNMVNPDDKTFSIQNPNASYGFMTITSIHYAGPIDFTLTMNSITPNSATIGITKIAGKFSNLKQIGYQVVVGVEEAFINLGLKSPTGAFSSDILPIQQNRWFFIPLQGLNYNNNNNIRIRAILTTTQSTIQYTYGTWDQSETPNRHSQIWVAYQFTNSYKALECFSIRTSRKHLPNLSIVPPIYFELVSLNAIYTSSGNYNYIVNKSIMPLYMIIQSTCPNGKKIQADFNKCNSCSVQKSYSFTFNCFSQMNYIGFFPKFKQAFQQYNQLKINLQSSSLEIIQVLYDQKITEQIIVKVQIVDQ